MTHCVRADHRTAGGLLAHMTGTLDRPAHHGQRQSLISPFPFFVHKPAVILPAYDASTAPLLPGFRV